MKTKYLGQCDKIRRTILGDKFWYELMKSHMKIHREVFLLNVDPSNVLDEGETVEQFMQGDPEAYFAVGFYQGETFYFIGHSGFEFIWQAV